MRLTKRSLRERISAVFRRDEPIRRDDDDLTDVGRTRSSEWPIANLAGVEDAVRQVATRLQEPAKPQRGRTIREWTSFGIGVLGLAGIIVSLRQLDQSAESATAENQRARYQTVSERLLDMDEALAQHPDLRPYFSAGRPVDIGLDPATQQEIFALATQRVDYDEFLYNELLALDIAPDTGELVLRTADGPQDVDDDWLAWSETIVADFQNSPAMCMVVTDSKTHEEYGAFFINALVEQHVCPQLQGYVAGQ